MSTEQFHSFIQSHWRDAMEIGLLWFAIHQGWQRFAQTRGFPLLVGVLMGGVGLMLASELLQLPVVDWLLRNFAALSLFALIVIFQPELRRIAASLGSNRFFSSNQQSVEIVQLISELAFDLANRELGGSIVIERDVPLDNWAESGVYVDGRVSVELGVCIFQNKTPLHDGALIVRNDRFVAAACILPLTERTDIDRNLGLRHRSALGLSDETDAVVIVVSEETGTVSVCHRGEIQRNFDPETLRTRLSELLSLSPDETAAE
jgi:diadenylate cyclase